MSNEQIELFPNTKFILHIRTNTIEQFNVTPISFCQFIEKDKENILNKK